jgi:CheY-like chemotaxis protein
MKNDKAQIFVLLADDDIDDCHLFADALGELKLPVSLDFAVNGVDLMRRLNNESKLPDLLFLDLNMPLKNGMECLKEIKIDKSLNKIPIIIFSTSAQKDIVDIAYRRGADMFVKKPDSFSKLREILGKIFNIRWQKPGPTVSKEDFLIDI